jgi:Ca2+-transporting ATPase
MQRARTEIFYLFLIFKLTIAVSFRSFRYSIVQAPPHKWLVLAILWELAIVAALVALPTSRAAFGIQLPTARDPGIIAGFSVADLLCREPAKSAPARGQRRSGVAEPGTGPESRP